MAVVKSSLKPGAAPALADRRRWGLFPIPPSFAPLILTPLVLFVHGYHPFAGDAGIYVAGIRHLLDPSLYPMNAIFPAAFTRLSIFAWVLAAVVRVTHLRLAWVLLAAYLGSIFLFLFACRRLAAGLFASERVQWCSTLLVAACFSLPVAGTALVVMDPYVTARSFSTPLGALAVAACVERAWGRAAVLLALAVAIHPLMAAYSIAFALLYGLIALRRIRLALAVCGACVMAAGLAFLLAHGAPVSPAYRQALSLAPRTFLFLARWHWYEVLGSLLPLALFAVAARRGAGPVRTLSSTCLLLGSTSIVIAALFVPPGGPYVLVPLQVLRSFHPIYAVGVVLSGGVLGARSRLAAGSVVALLFIAMFVTEPFTWPGSSRTEWPASSPANPWQQAFLWIRGHTPRDAVFAFNPDLVYLPLEDEQGFRAIAERDHLADDKDAGIVAVMPGLADRWARQRNAQLNVDRMTDAARTEALKPLGANWLLLPPGAQTSFPCPWSNAVVKICTMK